MYNAQTPDIRCSYLKAQAISPGRQQWWLPLATRLECLSAEVTHAIIIIAPECIAVFHDRLGRYRVFDSHSRNAAGLPTYSGTAIIMTFPELRDLADHLHKLFEVWGASVSYVFVPVSFEIVSHKEHPHPTVSWMKMDK